MENNNQEYWINTASSVETNERPATAEEDRIETPKNKTIVYSKREARSIAYRYLVFKWSYRLAVFFEIPSLIAFFIMFVVLAIVLKDTAMIAGIVFLAAASIFAIILTKNYTYREYKWEEKRLTKLYGKEFVRQASFFIN